MIKERDYDEDAKKNKGCEENGNHQPTDRPPVSMKLSKARQPFVA